MIVPCPACQATGEPPGALACRTCEGAGFLEGSAMERLQAVLGDLGEWARDRAAHVAMLLCLDDEGELGEPEALWAATEATLARVRLPHCGGVELDNEALQRLTRWCTAVLEPEREALAAIAAEPSSFERWAYFVAAGVEPELAGDIVRSEVEA